jgi:hypothetical protein
MFGIIVTSDFVRKAQTGTGVLSYPWAFCLSHHFFVILYITCQIFFFFYTELNARLPYYDISNNITGETQHIIKYAGSGVSYRTYQKNKMDSEVSMF